MVRTLKPPGPHMLKPLVALSFITVLAAQVAQPGTVPALPTTVDGIQMPSNGVVGLVLFFLGSAFTTVVNLYLQKRDREWRIADDDRKRAKDKEERAELAASQEMALRRAAEDVKATAETKARETAETAKQVAEHLLRIQQEQHRDITTRIDQNTQMNEQALSAANAINAKIASIGAAATAAGVGRRATDTAIAELHELETVIAAHRSDEDQAGKS